MNPEDAKALSTVLSYLAKTIVAEAEKTRSEIRRSRAGQKRIPEGVKLSKARRQLSKLREENAELHRLLNIETNKLSK